MSERKHGLKNYLTVINRKRGSTAVFIAVILPAVISLTLSLIFTAAKISAISKSDSAINLAGDSLLSEYDYYVQRDYGLFLIGISDKLLSQKLNSYLSFSTNSMNDMELNSCNATSSAYCVVDPELIKAQIKDFMKHPAGVAAAGEGLFDGGPANNMPLRTLRHGPTKASLPSRTVPKRSLIDSAEALGETISHGQSVFNQAKWEYFLSGYVLQTFNSDVSMKDSTHFFRNEVEYILSGKYSDEENSVAAERLIRTLRTAPNLAHIYSDPAKISAVTAAAEAITPGPLGVVTIMGLATSWAVAESFNDVKLLKEGYRVPLVKDKLSWAVDLESVVKNTFSETESKAIVPDVNRGYKYNDYLRLLLIAGDDNITTARILDLIQINMRKNHDKNFLIGECSVGLSINAVINKKQFSYDKKF